MSYRQLTLEQRYQIGAGLRMGMKQSEIAKEIKVDKTTVWREIRRNSTPYRYNPSRAIRIARERHRDKRKHRIGEATWTMVEGLLRQQWSPEQISERLKLEGLPSLSHETIYLHIYRDKEEGGVLYTNLRRRRKYRKRIHKYCKRFGWDSRRPISERPAIVETRSRLGDWEADTIIGREKKGGILSLVERRSRFCLLQRVPTKSPETVAAAICERLMPVKDKVITITSDNGFEFRLHHKIAFTINADFFFADPYSSWQRGTNENTNGLVRQYFPKKTVFDTVSDSDINFVTDRLNNRPRKVLGFKTPFEIFNNRFVALIT
ncbi:MAG: IS30 family transposase [Pyrinomonadaceae bacterium]